MKIKVKVFNENCIPEIIQQGDWIDLKVSETREVLAPNAGTLKYTFTDGEGNKIGRREVAFCYCMLPLGVAMKLPKGYEAIVAPRSSTFKKYGLIQANSMGIIDNTYCGDNDQWMFPAVALKDCEIPAGTRVCQFRIQLSQKATMWQKIKWLFSSKIEFEFVDHLNDEDRGGFGSTDVK